MKFYSWRIACSKIGGKPDIFEVWVDGKWRGLKRIPWNHHAHKGELRPWFLSAIRKTLKTNGCADAPFTRFFADMNQYPGYLTRS